MSLSWNEIFRLKQFISLILFQVFTYMNFYKVCMTENGVVSFLFLETLSVFTLWVSGDYWVLDC